MKMPQERVASHRQRVDACSSSCEVAPSDGTRKRRALMISILCIRSTSEVVRRVRSGTVAVALVCSSKFDRWIMIKKREVTDFQRCCQYITKYWSRRSGIQLAILEDWKTPWPSLWLYVWVKKIGSEEVARTHTLMATVLAQHQSEL